MIPPTMYPHLEPGTSLLLRWDDCGAIFLRLDVEQVHRPEPCLTFDGKERPCAPWLVCDDGAGGEHVYSASDPLLDMAPAVVEVAYVAVTR